MAVVRCPICNQPLRAADPSAGGMAVCPSCGRQSVVAAFPALVSDGLPKPPVLPDPPAEGEAACYYSPNRRATTECSHCGVLISDVWAAQWGSSTVCLKCLEHLRQQGKDDRFQSRRVLWDNIALVLVLVPFTFIFWWAVFLTAPAVLFIGFRHWNTPRSMVPRGHARLLIAMILAFLEIGGIVLAVGSYLAWFNRS